MRVVILKFVLFALFELPTRVSMTSLVPKFASSNPAEAVGFLRAEKSSAYLPSEGK
jgi:hypothetical protein